MTATNHILTGALIAVTIENTLLAFVIAILSHFVLDIMPQYGLSYIPEVERDSNRKFRIFVGIDAFIALTLFIVMPHVLHNHVNLAVSEICMLLAQLPDTVWFYRHMRALRAGSYKPAGWFARFHKAIQWCERPWGLYFEAAWLLALIAGLRVATR